MRWVGIVFTAQRSWMIVTLAGFVVAATACSTNSRAVIPASSRTAPQSSERSAVRGYALGTAGTLHQKGVALTAVPPTPPAVTGRVYALSPGVISLDAGEGCGFIDVAVNANTTYDYNGLVLQPGKYVQAWGTGSCATGAVTATNVAVWKQATYTGPISGTVPGIIEILTSTCGYLDAHVDINTAYVLNGLQPTPGTLATVTGLASCSTMMGTTTTVMLGTEPNVITSPSPAPTTFPPTLAQKHVLTMDKLGGYSGTRKISWSAAAPYVDWAITEYPDATPVSRAGIRTILYTNPNRTAPGDPMHNSDETTYAHDCNGSRLSMPYQGKIQNLRDPHSAALGLLWTDFVVQEAALGHVDAVYDDDPNDLYGMNGVPCTYDALDWMNATTAMIANLGYPVFISNIAGLNSDNMMSAPNAIAGATEDCYGTDGQPTPPYTSGSLWTTHLTLQLKLARMKKLFLCFATPTSPARSSIAVRQYIIASFMLAFDSSSSVLWEDFGTPSDFHVMPETQLVPTYPTTAAPANASGLQIAPGIYAREYQACYLAGSLVGPCAAVVNTGTVPVAFPLVGYTRTLAISGDGVLDGGVVAAAGPAPGIMPALSGTVAFN